MSEKGTTSEGQAEPKKSQTGLLLLLLAGGLAALFVIGWLNENVFNDDDDSDRAPRVTLPSTVEVVYEVEGSGLNADVTYTTPSGLEQGSPDLPMHTTDGRTGLTFKFSRGTFVQISAQKTQVSGDVTCRITVDGIVISENTSSASYGIASCKGSAG